MALMSSVSAGQLAEQKKELDAQYRAQCRPRG